MHALTGKVIAYQDTRISHQSTIRHSECTILIPSSSRTSRCNKCANYRRTLRVLAKRLIDHDDKGVDPHSHTNYRYLTTPEKVNRLSSLHGLYTSTKKQLDRLKQKVAAIADQHGNVMEQHHDDFLSIMEGEGKSVFTELPENSFKRIFWQQQFEAASRQDKRGMRWHPLMVKWCLYLRHQSNKAYETLRDSRCISLPSQRTLRDYTHFVKACSGFSAEVDNQLSMAANLSSCEEYQKLVILLLDEMHIKEDLIYDKHSGNLTGFANLGEINTNLLDFERQISDEIGSMEIPAKTMMVFMVRGLFTALQFPYVQFPVHHLTGDLLFDPFWDAVSHLERMGLKVG